MSTSVFRWRLFNASNDTSFRYRRKRIFWQMFHVISLTNYRGAAPARWVERWRVKAGAMTPGTVRSSTCLGDSSIAEMRLTKSPQTMRRTPAVSVIASAPQKVTRTVALNTDEPPTRAAKEPRSARKNNELPDTVQTNAEVGTTRTSKSGMAAPTAKVAAEASAA